MAGRDRPTGPRFGGLPGLKVDKIKYSFITKQRGYNIVEFFGG